MTDFNQTKLKRLDLPLLLLFLTLLRTRKATEAARALNMTPSAVSHALGRLRGVFEDELFLRRPHGLEPTDFALRLEGPVRAAVTALDEALKGGAPFDPAAAEGAVRLAAGDNALAMLVPPLRRALAEEAPGLSLQALPIARTEAERALEEGRLDLALGVFGTRPAHFFASPLYRDGYYVAARAGHPALTDLSLKRFAAEAHLLVAVRGDRTGIVDDALAAHGLSRRIAATLPQFMPALAILAETDLLAVLPRRLVEAFGARFDLAWVEPPLELPEYQVSILRHARTRRDPLLNWVAGKLEAAVTPPRG